MAKPQMPRPLAPQVEDLQRRFSLTYAVVEELAESVARDRAGGDRTEALYREARRQLEPIAFEVGAIAQRFWFSQDYLKEATDVALRGMMVSVFMGAQVVALDVTLDGMALLGQAKGTDEEFLRHTIQSCTDVYTVHAAMVDSAMAADMDTLTIMRQVYRADPDGSAAAFNRLIDDFKLVKNRMLARA